MVIFIENSDDFVSLKNKDIFKRFLKIVDKYLNIYLKIASLNVNVISLIMYLLLVFKHFSYYLCLFIVKIIILYSDNCSSNE